MQKTTRDLQTPSQAAAWFFKAVFLPPITLVDKCLDGFRVAPQPEDLWVVHGDTLSTLVGSIWAKRMGGVIAHIEAGLRSNEIFRPFPEEITRRIVSRLARLHFPQDETSTANLVAQSVRGEIIPTNGNTLYDALDVLRGSDDCSKLPEHSFVIANIHRNENLNNQSHWECILDTLCLSAQSHRVYMVMHPPTEFKLKLDGAARQKLVNAGIIILPRVNFRLFIQLINKSAYVISDGGSNQEECAYLGKPCLIMRKESERIEGLTRSCLLSEFIPERIHAFLGNPESYAQKPTFFSRRPSSIIVQRLHDEYVERGGV